MKTKLFFEHSENTYPQNKDFSVHVLLDTNDQVINAVEATVTIDTRFDIKEIRDGDSDITFWLTRPSAQENKVAFSGIVPGGVNKEKTKIVTFVLTAKENGMGNINAQDVRILQNDGQGSLIKVDIIPTQIQISGQSSASDITMIDTEKPESFVPLIARDQNLFDGKNFLVFSTQDKKSGVKEYQVKEGILGSYTVAQSPYELKHQKLTSFVYVKAIDNKGNERVERIPPQHISPTLVTVVCLCVVLLVIFIWKRTFSRS